VTAKTTAQRQAKHKAEQAALGIKEVRGIMAHVNNHDAVRKTARKQIAGLALKQTPPVASTAGRRAAD
jgi:hypothetical protein